MLMLQNSLLKYWFRRQIDEDSAGSQVHICKGYFEQEPDRVVIN